MTSPTYSRAHPSPRFVQLAALYRTLHEEGDGALGASAEDTFKGVSLTAHVAAIKSLIGRYGARRLLDYGAGKAAGYEGIKATRPDGTSMTGLKEIWGLDDITLYDPGYAPLSRLPVGTFDAVVCTDVLEHCPEDDLPWILDEIFAYADVFVYCSIACYPAKKTLPNGENAHITQKSPGWWLDLLDRCHQKRPHLHYVAAIDTAQLRRIFVEV